MCILSKLSFVHYKNKDSRPVHRSRLPNVANQCENHPEFWAVKPRDGLSIKIAKQNQPCLSARIFCFHTIFSRVSCVLNVANLLWNLDDFSYNWLGCPLPIVNQNTKIFSYFLLKLLGSCTQCPLWKKSRFAVFRFGHCWQDLMVMVYRPDCEGPRCCYDE